MKTQIQTLLSAAITSIQSAGLLTTNLPDPLPRVWRMNRERPDGGMQFKTLDNQQIDPWNFYHAIVFPGSVYQEDGSVILISAEKPNPLNLIRSIYNNDGWTDYEPFLIEWQDEGAYDPMVEATLTITRLQETEVVLRDEIARQASQIAELEQRIAKTNAAIDAAQEQA